MTEKPNKRIIFFLTGIIVCLLIVVIYQFVEIRLLRLRVASAREQIEKFEELSNQVVGIDAQDTVKILRIVAYFYPGGIGYKEGSDLDMIVENEREQAINKIISHLKNITGENLGDDPEAWIEKYRQE